MSRAERMAKSTSQRRESRVLAMCVELRNIARNAPMSAGTRNRLHAIAHAIEELGMEDQAQIQWTGAVIATPSQCIYPTCGLRHGIETRDGGF